MNYNYKKHVQGGQNTGEPCNTDQSGDAQMLLFIETNVYNTQHISAVVVQLLKKIRLWRI